MARLPSYKSFVRDVELKRLPNGPYIRCALRRRFVRVTPEELTRQYVLKCLLLAGYSSALMVAERQIAKRARVDLMAYDRQAKPYLLVECKRADLALSIDNLLQLIRYHTQTPVRYIALSNGIRTHCIPSAQPYDKPMDHFPAPPK